MSEATIPAALYPYRTKNLTGPQKNKGGAIAPACPPPK